MKSLTLVFCLLCAAWALAQDKSVLVPTPAESKGEGIDGRMKPLTQALAIKHAVAGLTTNNYAGKPQKFDTFCNKAYGRTIDQATEFYGIRSYDFDEWIDNQILLAKSEAAEKQWEALRKLVGGKIRFVYSVDHPTECAAVCIADDHVVGFKTQDMRTQFRFIGPEPPPKPAPQPAPRPCSPPTYYRGN
jgi:hypothetical protein